MASGLVWFAGSLLKWSFKWLLTLKTVAYYSKSPFFGELSTMSPLRKLKISPVGSCNRKYKKLPSDVPFHHHDDVRACERTSTLCNPLIYSNVLNLLLHTCCDTLELLKVLLWLTVPVFVSDLLPWNHRHIRQKEHAALHLLYTCTQVRSLTSGCVAIRPLVRFF